MRESGWKFGGAPGGVNGVNFLDLETGFGVSGNKVSRWRGGRLVIRLGCLGASRMTMQPNGACPFFPSRNVGRKQRPPSHFDPGINRSWEGATERRKEGRRGGGL